MVHNFSLNIAEREVRRGRTSMEVPQSADCAVVSGNVGMRNAVEQTRVRPGLNARSFHFPRSGGKNSIIPEAPAADGILALLLLAADDL